MKVEDYHIPVLLKQSVDGLNVKPDGIYVDVTFGGGGHSREILSRLSSDGHLFSFDQETIFNFWTDYPDKLTPEQIEIFKKENPIMAELK